MSLLVDVFPNYNKEKKELNEEDDLKEYRKQLKEIIKTSPIQPINKEKENKEKPVDKEQMNIVMILLEESISLRKELQKSQSNLETLIYILILINIFLTIIIYSLLLKK